MQDRTRRTATLVAAVAAAVAGIHSSASAATWNDPTVVSGTINVPLNTSGVPLPFTATIPLTVVDGTAIKFGPTAASPLAQDTYYFFVGQGSTPAVIPAGQALRLSTAPGGPIITSSVTLAVSGTFSTTYNWHDGSLWTGGVPNAVGANATFSTASTSSASQVVIDRNTTVGTIDFNGDSLTGMSVVSTLRYNAGPTGVLRFATPAGSPGPKITVSNTSGLAGQSFSLSESRFLSGANPALANGGRLVIAGNQGLTIENNNPIQPFAINGTPATTATSSAGAFRFGGLTDWSRFSGDLVLAKGAFSVQVPNNAAAGNTSLPMNQRIVLGTGTNAAQLESPGNSGLINIRGLDGNSASTIVNHSTGSGPAITLGSFSRVGDSYTHNGNIGHPLGGFVTGSVPYNIRLVKTGSSTQELLGENSFFNTTAGMVIHGGTLSLGSTGTVGLRSNANALSATAHGAVTGTYAATPNDHGLTGSSATRFIFRNGELKIVGNSAGDRIQTINGPTAINDGGLIFKTQNFLSGGDQNNANGNYGYSTITLDASVASSGAVQLVSNTVATRNNGAASFAANANGSTVLYRGTNLGSTPGAGVANVIFTTAPTNAANGYLVSIGGTGTLGTPTAPVLRGSLADTSASGSGEGFATYGGANGVRPLNQATEVVLNAYPAANDGNNHRLNLAGATSITGVVTNTLQIDNTSGSPQSLTSSGAALNAKNGMLFTGNSAITLAGAGGPTGTDIHTGTAATDNEDVIFHNVNTRGVTIDIPVSNPGTGSGNTGRQGWITYSGSGDYTINGTQTIGAGGGLALNSTGTTTLNGVINGSLATSAHQLAISRGNVRLGSGYSTANPNLNLVVASGASLDLNGVQTVFDAIHNNGLVQNSGGDNFSGGEITNSSSTKVELRLTGVNAGAGTSGIWTGVVSGNLDLVVAKLNATQRIGNVQTYTGSTTVRNGATLSVTRYGNLPSTTDLTLGDATTAGTLILGDVGGTYGAVNQTVNSLNSVVAGSVVNGQNTNVSVLTVNNTGSNSFTGSLVGSLALRKTNTGTLTLLAGTAANTYVGGTIIEGGEVIVGADARLGVVGAYTGSAATIAAVAGTPVSPQVNNIILNGGALHTTATLTLNSNRGVGVGPIDGALGGSGGINVDASTVLTYAGIIANAGNTGSNTLNKSGLGTLLLNGASTMTGTINVNAGTLGGSGSVVAAVNVNAGATLAPGTSPGTFTINNALVLDPASFLGYELVGNNLTVGSGVNDLTTGVTSLILDGTLNVTEIGAGTFLSAVAGDKWRLINFSGSLTDNTLSLGSMPALSAGLTYSIDVSTPNQVNLLIVAIPEPTSLLAIGAVAGMALRRKR